MRVASPSRASLAAKSPVRRTRKFAEPAKEEFLQQISADLRTQDRRGAAKAVSKKMTRLVLDASTRSSTGNGRGGWQRIGGKTYPYNVSTAPK